MPQSMLRLQGAPEELRRVWNGPDDAEAWRYLLERGYELSDCLRYWSVTSDHIARAEDLSALTFLHLEWGYPHPERIVRHESDLLLHPNWVH